MTTTPASTQMCLIPKARFESRSLHFRRTSPYGMASVVAPTVTGRPSLCARQSTSSATSRYNRRGVTTRGLGDGGKLERDEAARFKTWAKAISCDHPCTAKALDMLADSYDRDARRHDEDAENWRLCFLPPDPQLSAYKLAAARLGLGDVGLRLQELVKTKEPKMILIDAERRADDIRDFLTIVVGVLRAVDAGSFYPVRTCRCSGCPFQQRCGCD